MCLQIASNNGEQFRVPDTYYISNDYTNVIKFMEITSNSTQNRQKTLNVKKDNMN